MILSLGGAAGSWLIDLTVKDEEAAAAAKAALWASIAAAGAATGVEAGSTVVGTMMAAKEVASIAIDDPSAQQALDLSADVVQTAIGGDVVELVKVGGAAAGGAAIGGAIDGEQGAFAGMQLASSAASGDASAVIAKSTLGGAGGVIAYAETSDATAEERRKAVKFGASLGTSIGGGLASATADTDAVLERRDRSQSLAADLEGAVTSDTAAKAAPQLGAEANATPKTKPALEPEPTEAKPTNAKQAETKPTEAKPTEAEDGKPRASAAPADSPAPGSGEFAEGLRDELRRTRRQGVIRLGTELAGLGVGGIVHATRSPDERANVLDSLEVGQSAARALGGVVEAQLPADAKAQASVRGVSAGAKAAADSMEVASAIATIAVDQTAGRRARRARAEAEDEHTQPEAPDRWLELPTGLDHGTKLLRELRRRYNG